MAPLKDEIGVATARRLAEELAAAWKEFPRRRFAVGLAAELEPLELLARVELLANRLAGTLPDSFPRGAEILWRALESPSFTGWMTLPAGGFVARAGIDEPDVALPLLAGLTPRFSSEFAIRPFIEHQQRVTYEHLQRWCRAEDEHVRRLVSEGTRPRLPWAPRLRRLVADPTPNIPLLDALVDDASAYVRRSVANHLNDISKDHPGLALELAARWQQQSERGAWIVRHGLRTLVKHGDPEALSLVGAAVDARVQLVDLRLERDSVEIGNAVSFAFTLATQSQEPVSAVIDYRVHHRGAQGLGRPKVFKLTRRRLEPGAPVTVARRHRFAHTSGRRILPGRHVIDLQVNGQVLGSVDIDVRSPVAGA